MTAVQEARARARRARVTASAAQAVAGTGAGVAAGLPQGATATAAETLPREAPAPGRRHAVVRGVAPARPDGWAPAPRPRPRPRLRRGRVVAVSAGAIVALLMFAVVAFHVVLTQRQFRLDRMQQQLSQAQIDHAELTLEVAQLEAPARIVSVAVHRLHMVNPPRVVYLIPGDHPTSHKVSGVPASAPARTASTSTSTTAGP